MVFWSRFLFYIKKKMPFIKGANTIDFAKQIIVFRKILDLTYFLNCGLLP
jgi:hypothetical protein